MAGAVTTLRADTSEIQAWFERVSAAVRGLSLEQIPELLRNKILGLLEGGFPDGSVVCLGTTTVAGDHVMRFGVSRDLERLAVALCALERDGVAAHDFSLCD